MSAAPETLDGLEHSRTSSRGQWGRRAFLAVVATVVLAGLLGLLGVRTVTVGATGGGYDVEVVHAQIARAGIDVPWEVRVTHPGGFGKEIELAVTATYFDIFETQGFIPEPSKSTRDGETWYLTFDAPTDSDTFVLGYDAYIQPSAQRGAAGTLSVLERGLPVATVQFRTRLLP